MASAHNDMGWPGLPDGSTDSARASEIVGAWYGEVARHFTWRYDQWFDPACRDVARALLGAGDLDEAVVRLGAARAAASRPLEDTLADFASLLDVAAAHRVVLLEEEHLTAALVAGHEAGQGRLPTPTGFAGPLWLQERLATLYAERDGSGVEPLDTHAVLLVDVPVEMADREAGLAVHTAAEAVRTHLPLADQVVCLAPTRFAVLVHRHPGLALSAATLDGALRNELPLADVDVAVWVETLPSEPAVVPFVGSLISAPPRPGGAARAGLGTAAMTGPLHPEHWQARLQRRMGEAWDRGLSLVAAGVLALLVAAGLAQAVGPSGPGASWLTAPLPAPDRRPAPLAGGIEGRTIPTTTTVAPTPATSGALAAPAAAAVASGEPATLVDDEAPVPTVPRPTVTTRVEDDGQRTPATAAPTTSEPSTPPPTTPPTTTPPVEPQEEQEVRPGKRKGRDRGTDKEKDGERGASVASVGGDRDRDQPRGRPKTS